MKADTKVWTAHNVGVCFHLSIYSKFGASCDG